MREDGIFTSTHIGESSGSKNSNSNCTNRSSSSCRSNSSSNSNKRSEGNINFFCSLYRLLAVHQRADLGAPIQP